MAESFNLFDRELIIEDDFLLDIVLHGKINELAASASKMFEAHYHDKFHNIEDILSKGDETASSIFKKCADTYCDTLASMQIYSVMPFDIISHIEEMQFEEDSYFDEVMSDLTDWYYSSKREERQKDISRKARRKNRSKVVIKGRTLTGSIVGAATAGTINLASGAVHGTVNIIGKGFSSIGSSIEQATIFNDPNTCERFCTAIYMDVFDWIYLIENILIKDGIPLKKITIADEEKCENLFESLRHANLSQSQAYDIAFQLCSINPSEFSYYDFCLQKFPEQQANLIKLARYCKVDLTSSIDNIFQTIFNTSQHKTEDNVKLIKENMRAKQEELGVTSSAAIEKVDNILQDFDVKARSFQSTTYETREQRQKAEADFNELTALCGKINKLNLESCIRLIEEISEKDYVPNISKTFLHRLELRKRKLERGKADSLYKTIFKQFETENSDLKKYKIIKKLISVVICSPYERQ